MVQKLDAEVVKRYGIIVVDESHCLKNRDTKRTQVRGAGAEGNMQTLTLQLTLSSQFVSKVVKAAKHAILLTGTPLLSKPIEVFPQVKLTPHLHLTGF